MEAEDDLCTIPQDAPTEEHIDMVTSEVNTFLVIDKTIQPLHNSTNVVAKLHFTLPTILIQSTSAPSKCQQEVNIDADGDMMVPRAKKIKTAYEKTILIEFVNSTTLDLVALQIWRGAFVLSDFILKYPDYFFGKTVLELGSGTGFSSIVASIIAQKVIITDLNDKNILGLIQANLNHNVSMLKSETIIKPLDFLNLSWTPELEALISESDVLIAADVVYHDKITDGFVLTLEKALITGKPKDVFIALEKRYVFTLADLDVVAPAYDYFVEKLESVMNILLHDDKLFEIEKGEGFSKIDSGRKVTIHQIPLTEFPIYFNYEPSKDLILWHISNK